MRGDLADGHLNVADDWLQWSDALVFREEQRAIGESMIPDAAQGHRGVLGYAAFCRAFEESTGAASTNWLHTAASFILNLRASEGAKDFRRVRCLRMLCHLIDLVELLDASRVTAEMRTLRATAATDLQAYLVGEPV